jgi:hypothetical protein
VPHATFDSPPIVMVRWNSRQFGSAGSTGGVAAATTGGGGGVATHAAHKPESATKKTDSVQCIMRNILCRNGVNFSPRHVDRQSISVRDENFN